MNYSNKNKLGKVYLNEELKRFTIPMVQRNASKQLSTVSRGSKFKIDNNTNYIRGFVYWKEPQYDRVDLDLSVILYNNKFESVKSISYQDLRSRTYGCYHLGDITAAPHGASEYVDIDLNKCKNNGIRYISLVVNSYTETPFKDLPECFVGFMNREDCNSGEIYEPKTVINKSDITCDSKQVLPIVIDLETNEVTWCDLSIKNSPYFNNNITNNKNSLLLAIKSILNTPKANIYDLIKLHVNVRGELVNNKEEADIIFDIDEGITPYDTDIILGEYI